MNEELIMELSSELLTKASKKAREIGRNSQANKFAIAAGEALKKELKSWKPGPDAKNCGKVVAAIKDLSSSNQAMKNLTKADPAADMKIFHFPVLSINKSGEPGEVGGEYEFKEYRDIKIPKGKFYIFKDTYHGGIHFGTLSDICATIGSCYWDFEDFNASYIVKAFDDCMEATKWLKEQKESGKNVYDSDDFLNNVIDGSLDESDLWWAGPGESIIGVLLSWANVKNLPDNYDSVSDSNYK